jgi:hypothetical protein
MSTAVLEPPTTEEQLRERAQELASEVEERLLPTADPPEAEDGVTDTVASSEQTELVRAAAEGFFEELRAAVMSIARSPAWRAHGLTTELLLLMDQLRDLVEEDPEGNDPEWRQREALQRMLVVLQTMVRQLMHEAIDRPEQAARFVAEALADVEVSEVAGLLDITPRMVGNYRTGEVKQVRKNPNRITLIGQLVYELINSMTPRGVLLWFDAPMPGLNERTPRELIDDDPAAHRPALMALARGGRAQLDQGGALYGAVEHAA